MRPPPPPLNSLTQARDAGLVDTVVTLYELTEGDTGAGSELHGVDSRTLVAALRVLEQRGAAALLLQGGDGDGDGVKFLAG